MNYLKRFIDIIIASMALLLLAPLILGIALLVRLRLGRPVLFKQLRPGLQGRPFLLVKFRTMLHAKDGESGLAFDDQRLTGFGRLLRESSLDELPELWNVLRGEMSLVGPRPLLMQYLDRYDLEQARRHEVRPGLTGWAQVNGRNTLEWSEKFALDVWYVENQSLLLDLKILLMTVKQVLSRRGISAEGMATMSEFMGNEAEAPSAFQASGERSGTG